MRIIERYLLKKYLVPLIYISLSFILLYIIVDVFGRLDEIIRIQPGVKILLRYYGHSIPLILVQVLPFASLLAVIYSLGNLQRYNEIVAMHSCGVGLWKIMKPYIITGLFLSVLVFIVNEKFNPRSFVITRDIRGEIEGNKKEKQKGHIQNVTLYGQENRIIYARSYDPENKVLYDIIILQHDKDQTLTSRITAKLATWQEGRWKLYGIVLYHLDPQGQFVGEPVYMEDKEIDLTDRPEDFLRQDFVVEAMNISQLRHYIQRFKGGSEKISRRLLVELNYKKAGAFSVFVLTLAGIPFALLQNSAGKIMSLGISFGTGMLFYGLNAVSLGLGKIGLLPPLVAAWLTPLIFISGSVFLLRRSPR